MSSGGGKRISCLLPSDVFDIRVAVYSKNESYEIDIICVLDLILLIYYIFLIDYYTLGYVGW